MALGFHNGDALRFALPSEAIATSLEAVELAPAIEQADIAVTAKAGKAVAVEVVELPVAVGSVEAAVAGFTAGTLLFTSPGGLVFGPPADKLLGIDSVSDARVGEETTVKGTKVNAAKRVYLGGAKHPISGTASGELRFVPNIPRMASIAPYGQVQVRVETDGDTASAETSFGPPAGNAYLTIANFPPPSGQHSVLQSVAGQISNTDDLLEYEKKTSAGEPVNMASDGTFSISGTTPGDFGVRVYDASDSTWGSLATISVNQAATRKGNAELAGTSVLVASSNKTSIYQKGVAQLDGTSIFSSGGALYTKQNFGRRQLNGLGWLNLAPGVRKRFTGELVGSGGIFGISVEGLPDGMRIECIPAYWQERETNPCDYFRS